MGEDTQNVRDNEVGGTLQKWNDLLRDLDA